MPRQSPFKHHRFPRDMILCAVRWYLRYPLSGIAKLSDAGRS